MEEDTPFQNLVNSGDCGGDAMDSFHFERPFEFWDAGGRNFPGA